LAISYRPFAFGLIVVKAIFFTWTSVIYIRFS
jgi:hypothetical protein